MRVFALAAMAGLLLLGGCSTMGDPAPSAATATPSLGALQPVAPAGASENGQAILDAAWSECTNLGYKSDLVLFDQCVQVFRNPAITFQQAVLLFPQRVASGAPAATSATTYQAPAEPPPVYSPPATGYGEISKVNGLPRTHYVSGYFRSNGTYVHPYYRSR